MDPRLQLARTIVGVIGNIISFGLFLSPVPTISRFHQKKSTEDFHPYNYLAGIMNCILWVSYGLIHPNSTLVWTINAIGLVLYFIYLANFVWFTTNKWRLKTFIGVVVIAIATAAIIAPVLLLLHTKANQSKIIGIICIVFNIGLYGSPLTVVFNVFKTKSVEFLPFWVSLAGFGNGSVWTAYGLMPPDVNLLVGNGLGAVLSAFQLVLHVIYGHPVDNFLAPFKFASRRICCGGGQKEDQVEKPVELENVVVSRK